MPPPWQRGRDRSTDGSPSLAFSDINQFLAKVVSVKSEGGGSIRPPPLKGKGGGGIAWLEKKLKG